MEEKNLKNITIQGRNLIKELGLENLSKEKQAELIKNMSRILWKRIFLSLVDKLSKDETVELNNYLDKEDYKEADKYIAKKIPDSIEIFKREIETFQEDIIERLKV